MKLYIFIILIGISLSSQAQHKMLVEKQIGNNDTLLINHIDSILFDTIGSEMKIYRSSGTITPYSFGSIIQGRFTNTAEANILCNSVRLPGPPLVLGSYYYGTILFLPYINGNGGDYEAGFVYSSGRSNLRIDWTSGVLADTGSIELYFSGMINDTSTIVFDLNIAGALCQLRLPVVDPFLYVDCNAPNILNPNLTYSRVLDWDGKAYKTITIGNQEWMAENLAASHFSNGDPIPLDTIGLDWSTLVASAWIFHDSSRFHCPYGKFYSYQAAIDPRNVCPAGWHVPNVADWDTLVNTLGGPTIAGLNLKSTTGIWAAPNRGNNSSGFSALPAGYQTEGFFNEIGETAIWWEIDAALSNAAIRVVEQGSQEVVESFGSRLEGHSVRCVKD